MGETYSDISKKVKLRTLLKQTQRETNRENKQFMALVRQVDPEVDSVAIISPCILDATFVCMTWCSDHIMCYRFMPQALCQRHWCNKQRKQRII